jgi:predicted subunit of tRNA(5-methylaminomethyl-2-thiouridylate) methyltransferase
LLSQFETLDVLVQRGDQVPQLKLRLTHKFTPPFRIQIFQPLLSLRLPCLRNLVTELFILGI